MTLDELAQVATRDLAAATGRGLNPDAMLARLHRARRRRTGVVSVAAAAVLAVAVAGVGAAVGRDGAAPSPRPPAVSVPAPSSESPSDDPCTAPLVTCLGGGAVRVALVDPVVLVAPPNFEDVPTVFSRRDLQTGRTDTPDHTGVTVLERVVPVRNDANWTPDLAAGATPRSVATWLAHRPFLRSTTAVRVRVSGRPAWRVRTVLRDGAALNGSTDNQFVAPIFISRNSRAEVSPSLPGEFTMVGSPSGHGVNVIWSWTTTGRTSVLPGNRAMVAGISFP